MDVEGSAKIGVVVRDAAKLFGLEDSISGTFALAYPPLQKVFTSASNSSVSEVFTSDEEESPVLVAIYSQNILEAAQQTWAK